MKTSIFYIVFLFIQICPISAQNIGGRQTFTFLNLAPSARINALGSMQVAVSDRDPFLALQNPAALNEESAGVIGIDHSFVLADIDMNHVIYAFRIPKLSQWMFYGDLRYLSYGSFFRTDVYGNDLGTFPASEIAIQTGASRKVGDRLKVGAALKYVSSSFDGEGAQGIGLDMGGMYYHPERQITIGATVTNVGIITKKYGNASQTMPYDVRFGFTKKLKHLPFRFGIQAHHLYAWDIKYDDPALEQGGGIFGEPAPTQSKFSKITDLFFRHLVFNGEFLFGKKEGFALRMGYDHLRRSELRVSPFASNSGFSFGLGMKISKFRVDYGFNTWHHAGSIHQLSLRTDLGDF